jgi:hypothetical protein
VGTDYRDSRALSGAWRGAVLAIPSVEDIYEAAKVMVLTMGRTVRQTAA